MKDFIHTTKDGRKIPIEDMTNSHLINNIRRIERLAKEGYLVYYAHSWGNTTPYCDVDVFYGQEAKDELNYSKYMEEAKRRKLL